VVLAEILNNTGLKVVSKSSHAVVSQLQHALN